MWLAKQVFLEPCLFVFRCSFLNPHQICSCDLLPRSLWWDKSLAYLAVHCTILELWHCSWMGGLRAGGQLQLYSKSASHPVSEEIRDWISTLRTLNNSSGFFHPMCGIKMSFHQLWRSSSSRGMESLFLSCGFHVHFSHLGVSQHGGFTWIISLTPSHRHSKLSKNRNLINFYGSLQVFRPKNVRYRAHFRV